ncbi:RNA polymerase sigma factor [Solihabitans fulvus]|uniref:RNA polymerase sigma factor n=1 Tax=Solihabitans fulvus TaxID=1892852 RepID=A0A5B2WQF5_9PSEU|nr:RNA polymerase sigma factor [Solihabitans fulvus]KAA2252669.1 RNA polymerase sigma factor [Solihabitans fulvus]
MNRAHGHSTDQELSVLVRGGCRNSYETLYRRHVEAARRHARTLVRNEHDVDGLVSAAFAAVLERLRAGGDVVHFRAYVLTTLRHIAYTNAVSERRVMVTDDVSTLTGSDRLRPHSPDPVLSDLERRLAARAFGKLPARWRIVLWKREVEGMSLAAAGQFFGLSANGVSALAHRAREGLRQAYLNAQVRDGRRGFCGEVARLAGAWLRAAVRDPLVSQRIASHLLSCVQCRMLVDELADANAALVVKR